MDTQIIEQGLRAAETAICEQNLIWSRYSGDKPDVAKGVMRAFHMLALARKNYHPINIVSIGCGSEPQLRLLNAANHKNIVLIDKDPAVLDSINKRVNRQFYKNIYPVQENYEAFLDLNYTRAFLKMQLNGCKADAVFLHHSLYYLPMRRWRALITNIYNELLAEKGVIHCVLMSHYSDSPYTTTWLYNNYTRRFFNHINDQGLLAFQKELISEDCLAGAEISNVSSEIKFWVNDFEDFMKVMWMILLYPSVHQYSRKQMEIIIGDTYENFFLPQKPLMQSQDHLYIQKTAV